MKDISSSLFKDKLKNNVAWLFVIFCISILIGSGLSLLLSDGFSINLNDLSQIYNESTNIKRYGIRCLLLINHLFLFIIPSIVFFYFFIGQFSLSECYKRLDFGVLLKVIFPLLASCYLLSGALLYFNEMIPLPEYFHQLEDKNTELLKIIFTQDSVWEFLFNLFLVSIIPGIGEELVFRGILQNYLSLYFRPVMTVIIAAFIFSAVHGQFEGFLPRFFLGFVLGWLYYSTRSLIYPIILHILFNGIQVCIQYFRNIPIDQDPISTFSLGQVSLLFVVGCFLLIIGFRSIDKDFFNKIDQSNI